MTDSNQKIIDDYVSLVNKELDKYIKVENSTNDQKIIIEAMKHSVSAGGKRIRPILTLEFCKMCGGNIQDALPAAVAIEMIHTFSLIHDDMPCMDNDDFRRGKPSCHKAFGEATALLAGDALENLAFEVISSCNLNPEIKVKLINELSIAVGVKGMIGGQIIDMELETIDGNVDIIKKMYYYKTGALLKASCVMGCICANADEIKIDKARLYADNLGFAFQVQDDILDIIGSEDELGKPIGSDKEQGKKTYVSLVGIDKAKSEVLSCTDTAIKCLDYFSNNELLKELTSILAIRKN